MSTHIIAYLDHLVPTCTHDDGVLRVRAEPHARDPFSVTLLGNGKFAVSESVPQLDCTVARSRDDLAVVGGK